MVQRCTIKIDLLSYWCTGSGIGRGADVDELVLKDRKGLPYLPGKTLKGLLREGMQACEDAGRVAAGRTRELFGTPSAQGRPDASVPGKVFFSDAVLAAQEADWLGCTEATSARSALYERFSSTSLDEKGMARSKTLRTVELCVPVTLVASCHGAADGWPDDLAAACSLVRGLGSHRNRGLGRCQITVTKEERG